MAINSVSEGSAKGREREGGRKKEIREREREGERGRERNDGKKERKKREGERNEPEKGKRGWGVQYICILEEKRKREGEIEVMSIPTWSVRRRRGPEYYQTQPSRFHSEETTPLSPRPGRWRPVR